jgi:hypothetical protein
MTIHQLRRCVFLTLISVISLVGCSGLVAAVSLRTVGLI